MTSVSERHEELSDYIVALYELSHGDTTIWPTYSDIAAESLIPEERILAVHRSARVEGWANVITVGNGGPFSTRIGITQAGIHKAEAVITERENSDLPRYSTIVVLTDIELNRKLEPLLQQIRDHLEAANGIDPDIESDLRSDLESAQVQLRAKEPNRGVIKASLGRIKRLWPTIAGVAGVVADIVAILHGL